MDLDLGMMSKKLFSGKWLCERFCKLISGMNMRNPQDLWQLGHV